MKEACELAPQWWLPHALRGWFLWQSGQVKRAQPHIELALALNPLSLKLTYLRLKAPGLVPEKKKQYLIQARRTFPAEGAFQQELLELLLETNDSALQK